MGFRPLYLFVRNARLEEYRSGHNGPDSKSGELKGSVGSNPTSSAIKRDIVPGKTPADNGGRFFAASPVRAACRLLGLRGPAPGGFLP